MYDVIDGKRNLLAEEMLSYFWETCPALAARCEVAIVALPPLARREVVRRLQTLRAVTNETNRELAASRVAVTRGQVPADVIDRALASIEHLSEVTQAIKLWMDELLEAREARLLGARHADEACDHGPRQGHPVGDHPAGDGVG